MFKHLVWLCLLLLYPAQLCAGVSTLSKGKVWSKVTFFQQTTNEWYISSPEFTGGQVYGSGDRRPYLFNGEYDSKAFFIEGFYGVTDRLDVGVQVPFFDQIFDDDTCTEPPSESDLSDIRIFTKINIVQKPAIFTFKFGAKIPTGEFKNEDGLIPVGEGQWDFDFVAQLGKWFWPLPLYGNIDVGYRVRMENEGILRDPGDEWLINAELGGNLSKKALLMLKLEILRGKAGTVFGFKITSEIKRITYFAPTLLYDVGRGTALEAGLRCSLNGRNFPAGHQFTFGLSKSLGK